VYTVSVEERSPNRFELRDRASALSPPGAVFESGAAVLATLRGVETREYTPPSGREVASRVLCLAAIATLGAIAQDVQAGVSPEHSDAVDGGVRDWLQDEGLLDELAPSELAVLEKSLGTWARQELATASWRSESIGVLLWALSTVRELPAYDQQFERLSELLPVRRPTSEFLGSVQLRPVDALRHGRDVAELWHWRSRTRRLSTDAAFRAAHADVDLDEITSQAAQKAYRAGDIPPPIDGDLPWRGKAYRNLDPHDYSLATSIAMERHVAFNWLCGYGASWDEPPTDT
jgi:hypothetical protein